MNDEGHLSSLYEKTICFFFVTFTTEMPFQQSLLDIKRFSLSIEKKNNVDFPDRAKTRLNQPFQV